MTTVIIIVLVIAALAGAAYIVISRRRQADGVDSFRRQIDALSPEARRPVVDQIQNAQGDTHDPDDEDEDDDDGT